MSERLNEGQGLCRGEARMLVKPVRAVIELGAAPDVANAALNAVHHANRHGPADDFVAVALPTTKKRNYAVAIGEEIELVGSERSLSAIARLEGVVRLARRGMIADLAIEEPIAAKGDVGAAYVRDRSIEKRTPGWIRRTKARAERRGKALGKAVRPREIDRAILALSYGDAVIHVREVLGMIGDAPLLVSTYGFSRASAPAILPIMPNEAQWGDVAA